MSLLKSLLKRDWFVGLAITILFLVLSEAGWFSTLDQQAYNLGVKFSAARDPHEDIVVVEVDDKSLQALGAWPWSRDVLAETTRLLGKAKPRVIGITMPFDTAQYEASLGSLAGLRDILKKEKKLSRRVNKALRMTESTLRGDDNLANSFKLGGRIVLAMPYLATRLPIPELTPALPAYIQKFSLPRVSLNQSRGLGWPVPRATRAIEIFPPIELLAKQVGGVGVLSFAETFNNEPLIVQYGREYLPSFALMLATRSKGLSMQHIETRAAISPMLEGKNLGADSDLRIHPRFYEDRNGKSAFARYPVIDLLDGSLDLNLFRDKIVIFGLTSARLAQPRLAPTGQSISPTLAMAHTVSSLLNGEQYRLPEWSGWAQRGLIAVLGIYLMLVLGRLRTNTALFLSLFLAMMIFNAHFVLMSSQSIWLPLMSAIVMLIFGHLIIGTRQSINARLKEVNVELSAANRQLGQALHAQGNLDLAFEKFRFCRVDESLLSQVYNLGLDYERKRQFNKAAAVFKYIGEQQPGFNDAEARIEQNESAASTVVLGGGRDASGPGPTLISSKDGLEKPRLGRYQIDSEIGRGAMGMVYLGHDDKIGRTVAIKTMMLSDEIEEDMRDEVRSRFFREAEAAGRLDHPNIVTVYDVGDEQDLAYIAMDYLKGKDLTAYCNANSLLPVRQVFNIVMNVAMALDYAHQQHVVHRDIKPANIIYDAEKQVAKITDFGVACLTDASKTKTGTVLGSPSYMPPEQLAGKRVDGRADLFSLGVTLYQMLSGELPFKGDSIANLMYNIANEKQPDIRQYRAELPVCVNNVINKALQKEAETRFESGRKMAMAMKRCLDSNPEM